MNRHLKIIIPVVFIGILCYFGYQIYTKIHHKKQVAESIKTMPPFEYQDINDNLFTNANLKEHTPTLFIYFNTECAFCNEEAQMIKDNISKFTNFQLVFISFEQSSKIKEFAINHQLLNYDNITFLFDSKATFASTFDIKSLPCLVIYDKNKRLIEKIKGQTKVETLIKKLGITN